LFNLRQDHDNILVRGIIEKELGWCFTPTKESVKVLFKLFSGRTRNSGRPQCMGVNREKTQLLPYSSLRFQEYRNHENGQLDA
jgi:hypothetical protein